MPQAKRQRMADGLCWAHSQGGARCTSRVEAGEVPYCTKHLNTGDGAFKRVRHPNEALGDLLVARIPLPSGYRFCFWGDRTRCPYVDEDDRCLQFMSGKERKNPNGVINPHAYDGSLAQFVNAPAPSELPTARTTERFFGCHNDEDLVGQLVEVAEHCHPKTMAATGLGKWALLAFD